MDASPANRTGDATPRAARPRAPSSTSVRDELARRATELLVKHRWATVLPIVLPLSKGYDLYWRFRHVWMRNRQRAVHRHDERVRAVQSQIAAR